MVDVDYSTALVNCRQIAANCRHMTRGLYITSSGAAALLLSFLQLQILVYRQSNCIDLRDPLAVLISRLTESLTTYLLSLRNVLILLYSLYIQLNNIYFAIYYYRLYSLYNSPIDIFKFLLRKKGQFKLQIILATQLIKI